MATQRLYDERPAELEFAARVASSGPSWVVLDRTLFHPQGGGQPGDTGTLRWEGGEARVADSEEQGGEVRHVLAPGSPAPAPGTEVSGRVDRERRLALMRAHTGEHVLFRALSLATGGAATVEKISLEEDGGRIFVRGHPFDWDVLARAVAEANRVLRRGLPVRTELLRKEEVLSRHPEARIKLDRIQDELARVVVVEGYDAAACSGTHLASTAEVGCVAVAGRNKEGDATVLSFLAGERAAEHLARASCRAAELSELLSADLDRLRPTVENLAAEKESLWSRYKAASAHLGRLRLESLRPEEVGGLRLYSEVLPLGRDELIRAANKLIKEPRSVALLASDDDAPFLAFGASPDAGVDVAAVLRQAVAVVGGGGGGKPTFATGGGRSRERLDEAMALARRLVEGRGKGGG